jgi:hypothetical protein
MRNPNFAEGLAGDRSPESIGRGGVMYLVAGIPATRFGIARSGIADLAGGPGAPSGSRKEP